MQLLNFFCFTWSYYSLFFTETLFYSVIITTILRPSWNSSCIVWVYWDVYYINLNPRVLLCGHDQGDYILIYFPGTRGFSSPFSLQLNGWPTKHNFLYPRYPLILMMFPQISYTSLSKYTRNQRFLYFCKRRSMFTLVLPFTITTYWSSIHLMDICFGGFGASC